MNTPNKITCFRIILVPFLVFFLLKNDWKYSPLIALSIFILASVSDFLDGIHCTKK